MRTAEDRIVLLVDDNIDLCRKAYKAFPPKEFAVVRQADSFESFVSFTQYYGERLKAVVTNPWSPTFKDGFAVLAHLSDNFKQSSIPLVWTDEPEPHRRSEKRNDSRSRGAYELFGLNELDELVGYVCTTPIWDLLMGVNEIDGLTNLLNRRGFLGDTVRMMKIMQRVSSPSASCILMADMDNLKAINDTLGHVAGDKAIVCTAEALKASCRHTDVLGRYGGDEFVALLFGLHESEFEGTILPKLEAALESLAPAVVKEAGLSLSLSCGLSQFNVESLNQWGITAVLENTVEEADRKMYIQKEGRKGRGRS